MSWASISSNQCVSLNNLRDAIANSIFIAKTTVPAGTKQITKTEALAYVDIQTAPLASKASNQLVVKNNLNAAVYTYNRFDVNTTTCGTSNPIQHWSYYDIPFGLYNINGTGSLYQLIAATHTNFTNQITSYVSTTCTPVIQYTYITSDVNPTTCALSNTTQWWSYNNYPNGLYYINGPGTLYSLSASTHTNYTNQITSVSPGTCSTTTLYYYYMYQVNTDNCSNTYYATIKAQANVSAGYYYTNISEGIITWYLEPISFVAGATLISIYSATTCISNPCKVWYFYNSGDPGGPQERFDFIGCDGVARIAMVTAGTYTAVCVKGGTVPNIGDQGDNPYTFDETCT